MSYVRKWLKLPPDGRVWGVKVENNIVNWGEWF